MNKMFLILMAVLFLGGCTAPVLVSENYSVKENCTCDFNFYVDNLSTNKYYEGQDFYWFNYKCRNDTLFIESVLANNSKLTYERQCR